MNSAQQDELAALFAQSMHVSFQPQEQIVTQQAVIIEQLPQTINEKTTPFHFASAHYTQSAHIRSNSEPSGSPPPSYNESLMPEAMAQTLLQNSIDPAVLTPSQIQLFSHADYEQRLRLLELWRISPPSYPSVEQIYHQTTVEHEEAQARSRYEQHLRMQARLFQQHQEDMFDTHEPLRQVEAEVEPYIVNGYGTAQVRRSVDPIYAATAGMWKAPEVVQIQPQENQYGMYEQMRNHSDWERSNERTFVAAGGMDDEMVM
jgi:hypothetical protein